MGDVFEERSPQFRMYTTTKGYCVAMQCKRANCHYHGSFEYDGLAVDLARTVIAGHPEHRLTN